MKKNILIILTIIFVTSCFNFHEEDVIITKDYVINPNWDSIDNSFSIYRMLLKDTNKDINFKDPTDYELYHGLIKDSNFSFSTNIKFNGLEYSKRKVYFNKYNGFDWSRPLNMPPRYNSSRRELGQLNSETWYLLTGLSKLRTRFYIYIDSVDSLYIHKVSRMTNI